MEFPRPDLLFVLSMEMYILSSNYKSSFYLCVHLSNSIYSWLFAALKVKMVTVMVLCIRVWWYLCLGTANEQAWPAQPKDSSLLQCSDWVPSFSQLLDGHGVKWFRESLSWLSFSSACNHKQGVHATNWNENPHGFWCMLEFSIVWKKKVPEEKLST